MKSVMGVCFMASVLSCLTVCAQGQVSFTKVDAGAIGADALHCTTVSWGDYDGDGHVDLFAGFFTFHTPSEPHRLYRNKGDGTFTRVLDGGIADDMDPSYATSAVWVDYENDGDLDLYVTQSNLLQPSPDRLYLNNGDGTFTRSGLDWIQNEISVDSAWGDFDNDGLIDLLITSAQKAFLFHHETDHSMSRTRMNITNDNLSGVSWSDYDHDNDLDIFIAGEGIVHRNDGEGIFTSDPVPLAVPWIPSTADIDNDGDLDLAVVTFRGENCQLFINNGQSGWEIVPDGIASADGIGCRTPLWGDYDNDGFIDLLVTASTHEGLVHPGEVLLEGPNLLWHNNGDGTFTRVTEGPLVNDLGMSNSGGWADYDNDGDLDVALADGQNLLDKLVQLPAAPVALYRNDGGNENNWLLLTLVGTTSNRSAIGAKVFAHATIGGSPVQQMREVSGGQGRFSNSDIRVHFGLGDATVVDTLRIEWPSGSVQILSNLAANQRLTVSELSWPWQTVDGNSDTTPWMGWLWVGSQPWAWSYSLNKYIYCPQENISESGGWVYLPM